MSNTIEYAPLPQDAAIAQFLQEADVAIAHLA